MQLRAQITIPGPVQLCFSVEQHVSTLFALELLLDIRFPDGGHCGVIKVEPVATLLSDRKTDREKKASKKDLPQGRGGRKELCPPPSSLRPTGFDFSLWTLNRFCHQSRTSCLDWCCSAGPGPEGDEVSDWAVCSVGPGVSVTGLGGFALSATRVPLDTNMKTSLWDCKNCIQRK